MIRDPESTLLPPELRAWNEKIRGWAKGYGLDFFDVIFEILDYDELNEVAAYGGFPTRYPHWRFGMEYEELSKSYSYGLSKIYEMVINNNPCYAYLLKGNHIVDQKLVMAHVYGHCDFFKNNLWFSRTNRKMLDEMANHATRVRRYMELHGVDAVEGFIDACLSLDNLIDLHAPFVKRRRERPAREPDDEERKEKLEVKKLRSKEYMDRYVNPPSFIEEQRKRLEEDLKKSRNFPEEPERDVLLFLLENAPLERWQRDCLDIVREEAYYFAPQGMTKIMNEGWACVLPETPVFTAGGLLPMRDVVGGMVDRVSDGDAARAVYGRNVIRDHEIVRLRTRRGLALGGSTNHRVLLADGETWRRLDELQVGDRVRVAGGNGLWPEREVTIEWSPRVRTTLADVAREAGVSVWTVLRHRKGRRVLRAEAVESALAAHDGTTAVLPRRRKDVRVPRVVDASLGALLGYLIGDGHVSRVKRHVGLTSGDRERIDHFVSLLASVFGLTCAPYLDGGRWRALVHAETLSDFLVEGLGLTSGPRAREKSIPEAVLRSPEPVVRAFLAAYFDCDGHAGPQGVILSTTSPRLAEQTQLLLLNFGILSRQRAQADGAIHVHVMGASAKRFLECVGFGLARKQQALRAYVESHRWFKREAWEDEVVSLERGRADVYDISVEETHRYAAAGLVSHNSFWHSKIMTEKALTDAEVIDYADHHSGTLASQPGSLNPYKVGIELFRDIEERWDKGRFGKEWEECDDLERKRTWDLRLGRGREKIFEVRRIMNDILFIDEFLTPEFCARHKLFTYDYNAQTGEYVISGREFKKVKEKLLNSLTNFGQPFIFVEDGNYENRGEMLLRHRHDGVDLRLDWAKETLRNLQTIWGRPVHLETMHEKRKKLLSFDGKKHGERALG